MIRISGNTVIPFVTWANTPPDHQITSILLSEDGDTVATGSADGNVILWSLGNSCSCSPKWMLTGHKSLVSNLCIAGRSPMTGNKFFFSYSISGEMAVWNWNDGKCLEFKMDTRYRHTYIKSHQTCYLDYRLLFCCGQYAHIIVLHATSLAVLFTLASNSQPDWISSFVVVTHPNQRNEIVLGLSCSNLAILWTLDGEEIQGEAKYEHESRSINCPSTIIQVDCCPQTPRCILLVCSNGWQLFDAMTCSINCTVPNPTNDVLVGGSFIQSNVISVYGQSGFVYLYNLPKSLIIYSRDSICTDVPVHIATYSPFDVNNNDNAKTKANKDNVIHPSVNSINTTVQNFSCFTSAFIHPNDNMRYLLAGTIHGQLLAWCIKSDSFKLNIVDQQEKQMLLNDSIVKSVPITPPTTFSDLHDVWKKHTLPNIAMFLTSSFADSKYHSNLINPIHSSLDDSPTSSTVANQILCSGNTNTNNNHNVSVTVCIQINQMLSYQQPIQSSSPTIHPYRLAFGLSNGCIIIVRMADFLKTIYWHQHDDADNSNEQLSMEHHNRLSKFCLSGHIGPVTSLLHPASCERQLYPSTSPSSNDSISVNYTNNGDNITTTTNNNISSTITDYQFNPDYLLSGGMDFTVRLWDLNPWHESPDNSNISSSSRKSLGNNYQKSLCLATFRCHASPCIGLTICPPISSVINMVAGNPRLSASICSFGADGSVWLINLKEKRPFLYARNTSDLSSCPVVAIGWRLAEDLLFIDYLDGTVTVWDISMGCLERVETEQSARDLFEQAQFITEVYHPSTYLGFTFSTLPSITMSSYKSRSLTGVPNQYPIYTSLAIPFCGGVNSTSSSGTVHFTAPSRLKYTTVDDLQKLCTNSLPPVQLHLIGATTASNQHTTMINAENQSTWNSGPAAFIFHWDIQSLIVDILSQNCEVSKDINNLTTATETTSNASSLSSSTSFYRDDMFTMDVTQATFLQIIISLIHPWGIDLSIDKIIEQFCLNHHHHHHTSIDKNKIKTMLINNHQQQSLCIHESTLCIGLISKCGCMSLSMPGFCTKSTIVSKSAPIQHIPHPYCLSSIISTNLILSGVSLTELMTSLNLNYLLRLSHTIYGSMTAMSTSSSSSSKFLLNNNNNNNNNTIIMNNWRMNWLQFGAFLLERFIGLILSGNNRSVSDENKLQTIPPSIELNLFARKWQDRCLPIRYAARTLLLSCLDQLSLNDRKLLVTYWSSLLPPFALTNQGQPQTQQPQPQLIHQQNSLDSVNYIGYHIIDILANHHTDNKIVRKQSLPSMNGLEKTAKFNELKSLSGKDVFVQVNDTTTTTTTTTTTNDKVNQQFLSDKQQSTPSKQPVSTNSLPNLTESVSMSSLTSNLNMSMVLDSSWWMTLNGYRISPREHARLQAIAIVLMGIIGVRFGSSTKRRHPAVVARDLISEPLVMTSNRTYEVMNHWNCGLASPCFAAPDDDDDDDDNCKVKSEMTTIAVKQIPLNRSEEIPFSVKTFSQYTPNQSSEIQDGFGLDNHYLARSTCQCLSALLFNGGYPVLLPTDTYQPEIDWSKYHDQTVNSNSEVLPVYAANALMTLLTSNVNSTLRRAAIDLLGRGFPVWEPFVDVGQMINVLLLLASGAEVLLSSNTSCQLISDRVDLARTAREALWAIGFTRPKLITLALSLEVRRFGAQINAAASAITSNNTGRSSIPTSSSTLNSAHIQSSWSLTKSLSKDSDNHHLVSVSRHESIIVGNEFQSVSNTSSPNMIVMMTNPIVATPVFNSTISGGGGGNTGTNFNRSATSGYSNADSSTLFDQQCPPMFKARDEVLRLFEQLCIRRSNDIKDVLPEVVEVIIACSDRTRLKERGLDYVFPALTPYHAYSSHTRLQKACTGGVNGSLTFYDFKIGRYFVTMGHKGPVTAVCFNSDGRQVATYSLTESTLRIWQLHTTGFFGMGGQQVKPLSIHPVPPLIPPPSSTPKQSSTSSSSLSNELFNKKKKKNENENENINNSQTSLSDRLEVWIDWSESRVLHLITNIGIKRRIAL